MAAPAAPGVRASHLKDDLWAVDAELAAAVHAEAGEKGLRRWGTTSFLHSPEATWLVEWRASK